MNKNSKILAIGITLAATISAISIMNAQKSEDVMPKMLQNQEAKAEYKFDYNDQDNWEFESGKMQSPVNLSTSSAKKPENPISGIEFNLNNEIKSIHDNGHSIQVNGSGSVKIDNRNFNFMQVHFHSKSEHTIDSMHYPIEAHFVSQSENGRIAVVGVMFEESETDNEAFGEILSKVKKGEKVSNVSNIDLSKMLPENKSYFNYLGSLTTPPLSENVEWYVLKTPVKVSKAQIENFHTYYDFNNRNLQNIEDRIILEYNE